MNYNSWTDTAVSICDLEKDTIRLTAPWYHLPTHSNHSQEDVKKVHHLTQETLRQLDILSEQLKDWLQQSSNTISRETCEYAYNLSQELIQSRRACAELLENMQESDSPSHQEYLRAISLKGKAALEQAEKMLSCLKRMQ